MKIDLSVDLCGRRLVNPLILTSGILGTEAELMARVARSGAAGVTTKSCCLLPRKGHENPTVLAWKHGLINGVGLTNQGVEKEIEEIRKLRALCGEVKIIASFFGGTIEEFAQVAKIISLASPDFLEANISCPNTESDYGQPFAVSPEDTFAVTRAIKRVSKIPLIVKLSPNVSDIKAIAKSAEEAGADAISAINTLTGMIIDLEAGKPILTNKSGGISGPAILPLAVRCVYDIKKVVKIPIIGIGGVTYGEDAIQMIMAGAKAVGIGSAIFFRGMNVFKKIEQEIKNYLAQHNCYRNIEDLWGLAHEN